MYFIWWSIITLFGIGYLPASGTFASLVTLILLIPLHFYFKQFFFVSLVVIFISFIVGVIGSDYGERNIFKEKDSGKIVIDEFCGMLIACLPITFLKWQKENILKILIFYFVAFLLFRFFDISKIGFINQSQKLPMGYGVMMDDVLAGILSLIIILLPIILF